MSEKGTNANEIFDVTKDTYTFTRDCLIGVKNIDDEHEGLFRLINAVLKADKNEGGLVEQLIESLKDYAKTHFQHEEAYMQEINDPELPRQKREHEAFVQKLNELDNLKLADLDAGDEENCKVLDDIMQYLTRWLYHHILGSDILIGKMTPLSENSGKRVICEFTDEYKTGIELVDDEHRRLFEIIQQTDDIIHNDFLADKYDSIVNVLYELKDYTKKHFADEEAYMESIGYEGLWAQRLAHEAFVDRLAEINLDEVDDNQNEYLDELILFLLNWLKNHILMSDKLIPANVEE